MILPQSEASSILEDQARGLGYKQLEKGFMESSQLVFSIPSTLKYPFWTNIQGSLEVL